MSEQPKKEKRGQLFVVSAPSGAGKTSLVRALMERSDTIGVAISHTTRAKRPEEQDGINYHFVPEVKFTAMVDALIMLLALSFMPNGILGSRE